MYHASRDSILRLRLGMTFPFIVMLANLRRASIKRSNLPAAHTVCLWELSLRDIKPEKNKRSKYLYTKMLIQNDDCSNFGK